MLLIINKSCIYFINQYNSINDYYQYIVILIKKILENNEVTININFSNENYTFPNNNKTIRINFNYEHTLVKINGRGAEGSPAGNIKDANDNSNYLVRIDRYNELNNADIIIDYSNPNIYNVSESRLFDIFAKKMIYIAPSLYELYFIKENRTINTLTTFINIHEPRRLALLEKTRQYKIAHTNINNCFEKNDLQRLYKNTKILINIHQTDHHHTFEELRVLPALECGVIVISEHSPLSQLVPYSDFVIWENYDTILDKVNEVLTNYDYFYDLIFNKDTFKKLEEIRNQNYETLSAVLLHQL
uniref:Glycosyl transferase family 1 domain-containing protein n=1 Tax=viral metagenome TaxID=1070528 RepID=A0A6C0EV20_9ZZZZ